MNEQDSDRITRDDLEAGFRSFGEQKDETVAGIKNAAVAIGATVGVALVLGAFLLGRSRGRKKTTVVEIRRV